MPSGVRVNVGVGSRGRGSKKAMDQEHWTASATAEQLVTTTLKTTSYFALHAPIYPRLRHLRYAAELL